MADALDSKSSMGNHVWVQLPPPVLLTTKGLVAMNRKSFFYSPPAHLTQI